MRYRPWLSSWLLAAMLIAACLGVPAPASASDRQVSVLILLPGQPGLPAASSIASGIRAPLLSEWSFRVSLETEHVDIARFPSPEEEEGRLRALYGSKYRGQRFDLIVAASYEPLHFILRARDALWPGTPVIACALDERSARGLEPPRGVTVVTIRYDIEGTLRAALALLPDTERVALVGGAGPQEQAFHDLARGAVAAAGESLDLIDLTRLPVAALLARVATLPEHTVVLVSSYQVDGAGRRFYGLDIVGPLTTRANRPVFTAFGNALGHGIVGGSLTDFEAVGREAGALGAQVLRGSVLPASVVASASVSVPRFDGRQLARWRLDERRLPPGSEVLYRQPTLWQEYRWHITGAVGLIAAQAGLIGALLVQRRRRREAQTRLARQLRFETVVSDVAVALTGAPQRRTDEELRECLWRVGSFIGVDRAALWQPSSSDPQVLTATHAWSADGVPPPPAAIDVRRFPYLLARIDPPRDGLSFERPDALPPEAAAERAAFEEMGVRSFLAIPLCAGERGLGFLAFVSLHRERAWSDDVMKQLRTLAEPFANALMRRQSAAAVESSAAFATAVLAALPGETAIIDAAGTILQTNEAWTSAVRGAPVDSQRALSVGANYVDACRNAIGMPPEAARQVHASLQAVLRGERAEFSLEYPASRGGEDRWLEVRVRRLARPGGGAAVMRLDVTARRQAEAAARRHLGQIAHLDRVAGMGHLASSLAHELNQPLAAILANAQAAKRLLARTPPDLDELGACLVDIVSDDQRAAEVIRRMRRLLKRAEVTSFPLDLNDLTEITIGLVATDALLHSVSLEFTPAPALPVAYGDLVQIQQVILNLLTNAIAAAAGAPAIRKVTVWTAAVTPPYVEVGVHDSGPGITAGDLERLFEPFFTTKEEGLGMGLAISRTIVDAHGGRLVVDNDPAGGATFRLHLRTDRPDTT